jgi:hypothetical protein
MSKSALLAKLKGKTRTFVVHSNTSPYAAAAAMGTAIGRSQALGPYFHLSAKRVSGVQAEVGTGAVCELAPGNLRVDFIGDWAEFLRQKGMAVCGLKYDESRALEENTMRYLNAQRRIPITARRAVHESRELSVPQEYEADYLALKSLIRSGGNLKPYLSRDIVKKKRPDKNDGLLNAWGIQHLHFRPEGTVPILLCRITDTDVFVIQSLRHDHDVWVVDTSLLQILHDNWPEEIATGRFRGIQGEAMPASERLVLRNQNANFATTTTDDTVYLAPGGGLMASGDCSEDRTDCDKIFAELTYWQEIVRSNASRFSAALNWPVSEKLSIKMIFADRECRLYEPTTGTRLSLTIQE